MASSREGGVGAAMSRAASFASPTRTSPSIRRLCTPSPISSIGLSNGGGTRSVTDAIPSTPSATNPQAYPPLALLGGPRKRLSITTFLFTETENSRSVGEIMKPCPAGDTWSQP